MGGWVDGGRADGLREGRWRFRFAMRADGSRRRRLGPRCVEYYVVMR